MSTLAYEGPNAQQIEYWNEQRGRTWVAERDALDAQIAPFGRKAMDRAAFAANERVLDVGCGCGQTTLEIARRVGAGGEVCGADLSTVMLTVARDAARAAGVGNVRFVEADAQTYAFPPRAFDVLFSRFGVMFTFLTYGDNRTDPVAHASVVRAMQQVPSDFLVNTGDFVEDGREAADWQSFFDAESPLLRDRCSFACVGNHELLDRAGDNYLRYFGPSPDGDPTPRLYGTVRWGNTRFFFLNGQDTFDRGPESEWFARELDKATTEAGLVWRVAVVHFGYRSAGPHGDNPRLLAAGVDTLMRNKKVDLVISGHDHIYERGEEKGMRYVVSGGGGAPLYRVKQPLPSTRKVESTYHYVSFQVDDSTIKLLAKRIDGSTLDACAFTKKGGWDCDSPPKATDAPPAAPASKADPQRASSSVCGCGANGRAAGAAPFASLAVFGLLVLRRRLLAMRRRLGYARR